MESELEYVGESYGEIDVIYRCQCGVLNTSSVTSEYKRMLEVQSKLIEIRVSAIHCPCGELARSERIEDCPCGSWLSTTVVSERVDSEDRFHQKQSLLCKCGMRMELERVSDLIQDETVKIHWSDA